jgi:tetratricopeptide (TPR) repeat protein
MLGESDDPDALLAKATRHAEAAVAADDGNSLAHMALSRVFLLKGQLSRATEEAQSAIDLNPSSSGARLALAHALMWRNKADEALPAIDMSIRLSPKGPLRDLKLMARAFALYSLDRLDEAETIGQKVAHGRRARVGGLLVLMALLARQGRLEEAKSVLQDLLSLRPDLTVTSLQRNWSGALPEVGERFAADLRTAGLPE